MRYLTILICSVLLLFNVYDCSGATITWTGNVDDKWHDPGNWDTKNVPTAFDDVIISGATLVRIDVSATVQSLLLEGSYLRVGSNLTISGPTPGLSNVTIADNSEILVLANKYMRVRDTVHISNSFFYNEGVIEDISNGDSHFRFEAKNHSFTNQGIIKFNDVNNRDDITNDGTITGEFKSTGNVINNGTINGGVLVYDGGNVYNSGAINIDGLDVRQVYIAEGSKLDNYGDIYLNSINGRASLGDVFIAFRVDGKFVNYEVGNVLINNITNVGNLLSRPAIGMYMSDRAEFDNYGSMNIDSVFSVGMGIASDDAINHVTGTITITNTFGVTTVGGTDYGVGRGVDLRKNDDVFVNGTENLDGAFKNYGELTVTNSSDYGVYVFDDFSFINYNHVAITDYGSAAIAGYHVKVSTGFTAVDNNVINHADGVMNISRTTTSNPYPDVGLYAHTINHGVINIEGAQGHGLQGRLENHNMVNVAGNVGNASNVMLQNLDNKMGATINCQGLRLQFEGNYYYGNSTNEGKVNIEDRRLELFQVEELAPQHLINMPCGEIYSELGILISEGNIMENHGVFIVDNMPIQNLSPATKHLCDSLFNTGVITVKGGGDIMNNPEFFNEGIYIYGISGEHECFDMLVEVSSGPNSAGFASPMLTTDTTGIIMGGSYDLLNHSITLGGNVDSASLLYAHFEMTSGCTRAVPIFFDNTLTCADCATNTWEGNSSMDWHTPTNWSKSTVPSACEIVIIPDGSSCVISDGNIGECGQIQIEDNAILEVIGEMLISGS